MDLRQLAALVAIADHGSFSSAAKALYTVQSNVSGHIARLERELKYVLIERPGGAFTDEGLLVLERARRVLREVDAISAEMSSLGHEISGDVRLGVIGSTARWLMSPLLARLESEHPLVRPIVVDGQTSTLLPRLAAGAIDAALVHLPVDDPEFIVDPLFAEDLVLLAPPGHVLAGFEEVAMRSLADIPLLLPPRGTTLRRIIDRAATTAGVALVPQAEIDGVSLLAALAQEGFGAAIVPATGIPPLTPDGLAVVAVRDLPRRVVGWVNRRRPSITPPVRAARDLLRDVVTEIGATQRGVHIEPTTPATRR